jgi:hypothetical protein
VSCCGCEVAEPDEQAAVHNESSSAAAVPGRGQERNRNDLFVMQPRAMNGAGLYGNWIDPRAQSAR